MRLLRTLFFASLLALIASSAWALPLRLQWDMTESQIAALLGPPTSAPAAVMTESPSFTINYASIEYAGVQLRATFEGHPNLFFMDLAGSVAYDGKNLDKARSFFNEFIAQVQRDTGVSLSTTWTSTAQGPRAGASGANTSMNISVSVYPSSQDGVLSYDLNLSHF